MEGQNGSAFPAGYNRGEKYVAIESYKNFILGRGSQTSKTSGAK